MSSFLELVALDLLRRYPDTLHDVSVVFPGKRARLFLGEHLVRAAGRPVWSPEARTMQELFLSLSPYSLIDEIEAVCLLHSVFSRHVRLHSQTLDEFYGWGRVLLSDFDDIDKHLVNAPSLFANIGDLERLTDDRFLDERQESVLRQFFSSFSVEGNSQLRENFREMWSAMPAIYEEFVAAMRRLGRLTEGALMRDSLERLRRGAASLCSGTYAFVGLNALSEVEKHLMRHLRSEGRALFYWDYDPTFLEPFHEAGIFIRDNIKEFPNAIDLRRSDDPAQRPHTTYVSTAGQNVQARYIPTWLKRIGAVGTGLPDTAIVLCDETLLQPVLHAIPDESHGGPSSANITMGYPMTSTPVYSLLRSLMTLHTTGWDPHARRFRSRELRVVKRNPLIAEAVSSGLIAIDSHQEGGAWLVGHLRATLEKVASLSPRSETPEYALLSESVYRAHTLLGRISDMLASGLLAAGPQCLCGVIDQALIAITIPFHGEPAEGLQVMGLMETRCLDFSNLLLLSVGEGKLPLNGRQSSFIPYSLRGPFGLTTIEHRVGIQAYYFYRLLKRARNITFVYDTATSEGEKNEMSRFLRQLLVEQRPGGVYPDESLTLKPSLSLSQPSKLEALKTDAVIERLRGIKKFSPSALEKFIACPLRYYLEYIGGVKEYEEKDDEMDSATFGNVFHGSAESIYKPFGGRWLTPDDLTPYLEGPLSRRRLQAVVESQMDEHFFKPRNIDMSSGMTGSLAIRRDVIVRYLTNLLRHDLRKLSSQRRKVVGCEIACSLTLPLDEGKGTGFGTGDGTGFGTGDGTGFGTGFGTGNGTGFGTGDGTGFGTGDGTGNGTGNGTGIPPSIVIGGIIDRLDLVSEGGRERLQVIDYKTMSRGATPKKITLDMVFKQEYKHHAHIFQTILYSLTQRGPIGVQPTVFYTHDSYDSDYDSTLYLDGEPLTDVESIAAEFESRLKERVREIFDRSEPFSQTASVARCTYCPFKEICRK